MGNIQIVSKQHQIFFLKVTPLKLQIIHFKCHLFFMNDTNLITDETNLRKKISLSRN